MLATALVLAFPRLGWACACCDGRTGVELLGWSADGQELLVRNEELRACERRARLMVYRSGLPEPVRCFDLLGDPDRPVSCAETRASFDPAQTSQRTADFPRPLRSLSPQGLAATASLVVDGGLRKAAVRVLWLGDAGPKPVATFEAHEYYYYSPAAEEENELIPLEVSVLWPEGNARQAALLAAGFDEAPGIGHSGWRLRWISLPPGLRAEPGVHWIRAVADFGSSPRPGEESKQARTENTLGVRALEDGRLERARWHFEHALAHDPRHVLARYNLACVLARQGLKYHALRELETVMTKPPPEVVETRRVRALVDPDLASLREEPRFIALVGHHARADPGSAAPSAKASAGMSARAREPSGVPPASSAQTAPASGPPPSSASTVSREARCGCRASPPPDPWSSLVFWGLVLALGTRRRAARGRRANGACRLR